MSTSPSPNLIPRGASTSLDLPVNRIALLKKIRDRRTIKSARALLEARRKLVQANRRLLEAKRRGWDQYPFVQTVKYAVQAVANAQKDDAAVKALDDSFSLRNPSQSTPSSSSSSSSQQLDPIELPVRSSQIFGNILMARG
mmetsp:Transcript_21231/g.50459  ORF Transcript_21231/g.50459 Transcript_21231/m.50459 type:complete len:141 (-) Transcript_21231:937-1359(-)